MRLAAAKLLAGFALLGTSSVWAVTIPTPINSSLIDSEPYTYNGMMVVETDTAYFTGSASVINSRVALTAAHVVFDDDEMTWATSYRIKMRHNKGRDTLPVGTWLTGSQVLTTYSTAVQQQTLEQYEFNSDIAAVYHIFDLNPTSQPYEVRTLGYPTPLTDSVEKMVVGYPIASDSDLIPVANRGLMHQTGPANWDFFDYFGDYDTLGYDDFGVPFGVWQAPDVRSGSGNSGGPLYVRDPDDNNRWTMVAVLVGGGDADPYYDSIYRMIDTTTEDMLKLAYQSGNASIRLPHPTLQVAANDDGLPVLNWADNAAGERYWQVRRHDGSGWKVIASLPAGSTSYTDTTALPGTQYRYRVRTQDIGNSTGPWSDVKSASMTEGARTDIGKRLDTPLYWFTTGGDSPFFIDSTGVRSGKVQSLSESWLELTVQGAGTVTFDWSVNCEPGEAGDVYDSMYVAVDGRFRKRIEGTVTQANQKLTLTGSGTHTIRWTYAKDQYTQQGEDLGRVTKVRFDGARALYSLGAVATGDGYYHTPLFGYVYDYQSGNWIYDFNLGDIYLAVDGTDVWFWTRDSRLGWVWTSGKYWPFAWSSKGGWITHVGNGWFYCHEPAKTGSEYIQIGHQ